MKIKYFFLMSILVLVLVVFSFMLLCYNRYYDIVPSTEFSQHRCALLCGIPVLSEGVVSVDNEGVYYQTVADQKLFLREFLGHADCLDKTYVIRGIIKRNFFNAEVLYFDGIHEILPVHLTLDYKHDPENYRKCYFGPLPN